MEELLVTNYSRIKIGPSDENVKIVILKSVLPLSKTFITEPFGTNKMRFQYPEMFSYVLKTMDNTRYELTINRSKKILCETTAKYFWTDGWTCDLYITNLPDTGVNISELFINDLLPSGYGDITIEKSSQKKSDINIGIIVPLFSRNEYVEKFLFSLTKSDLRNCLLVFMDESLTKDINNDKMQVNNNVKLYEHLDATIIKVYKKNHGNMFDSILRGCDIASVFCNYLITIDSDTIHNTKWILNSIKTYESIKQTIDTNILLSPFNTINTGRHKIVEEKSSYYIKDSVGGCCMIFTKNMYFSHIRCTLISHKWDTNLVNNVKNNNGIIAVTKPSLIDHIGFKSSGHRNSNDNIYDVAMDFVN